eukprot:m51a1_g4487 hypothetical protein (723) ;mRNA; r:284797-287931
MPLAKSPAGKSAPDLSLHPVDRELEVEILVRTALANRSIAASEKPYLLYSSQMFGAGKTFFGEHAIPLLRDDLERGGPITGALLNPPDDTPREHDRANLRELRLHQPRSWTRELVAEYANARTVVVDLENIVWPTKSTFKEALYRLIFLSATGCSEEEVSFEPARLVKSIEEKTGHAGSWFFFFDEIGWGEQHTKAFAEFSERQPHLVILDAIKLFLRLQNVFVFCAGNDKLLADEMSLRLRTSPENVAAVVFEYSGGIGRLVKRTFEALLTARDEEIRGPINDVMEGYVSRRIIADTSAPVATLPEDSGLRAAYATALLLYITGTTFDGNLVVQLPDGGNRPILDLISQLGVHIKSVGSEFAFVFPKFTADWLSSCGDGVVSSMAGLMQYVSRFPAVLDRGHVLVLMLAQTLSIKLRSKENYSAVGAFSRSESFKEKVIKRTSAEGNFAIVPTPSFHSGVPKGKPSTPEDGRVHNFSTADWGPFSEGRLSTRTIGVPFDNSVGHDLDVSDLSAPWALFALKNLQGAKGNGTSFKVIREEISKTLVAARASESEALAQRRIVLFIVSTRLTKSVESVLRHGSLSLGPGTWYKSKNCELVVLGKEAMEELFGRMQLEQLTKYFESPNDVKRCNALISYQFGQVINSNPLFANPETKIDLEWLRAVFPKKDPNKLERWRKMLVEDNEVEDVGTLAAQKQESLERWGIPGAIAATLAEQAALCPK